MILFAALILSACKKQWDQRTKATDQNLNVNLMQEIKANSDLSTFAGFLERTGLDKELAGSKTYTVWAPTNEALQGLADSIAKVDSNLVKFVKNHITTQAYLTTGIQGSIRLRTLYGKNVSFTPTMVEDANITSADNYVSNGVLNVIDKPLTPRKNIAEYIRSLSDIGILQRDYIKGQDTSYVDTALATIDHLDEHGKPVLVAGTGEVNLNKYFTKVAALNNEDSTYTYFVLADNGFNNQVNKVTPYFATTDADTTKMLATFNVLKDVAVRGKVEEADLPATLQSVMGVNVPINKANIVRTYEASNGIVYVVNDINFALSDKIPTITIQGENPIFYLRTDKGGNVSIRYKIDTTTNLPYNDIRITNTGTKAYYAAYNVGALNTCEYKVVYHIINDTVTTHTPAPGVLQESIAFGPTTGITVAANVRTVQMAVTYPYFDVAPNYYNEVEATNPGAKAGYSIGVQNGHLNVLAYRSLYMYMIGANNTTSGLNDVLLDYIKLIPVLP
jgi:uncharacterized surface protein with fasciclin (FAS1) repeats